jgi:hypothetical protein
MTDDHGDAWEPPPGARDITVEGFTLPEKPTVQPCAPYERRPCTERELLERMCQMFPHLAGEIKKEFVAGFKAVKARRVE